jgi:hypothetical protein
VLTTSHIANMTVSTDAAGTTQNIPGIFLPCTSFISHII